MDGPQHQLSHALVAHLLQSRLPHPLHALCSTSRDLLAPAVPSAPYIWLCRSCWAPPVPVLAAHTLCDDPPAAAAASLAPSRLAPQPKARPAHSLTHALIGSLHPRPPTLCRDTILPLFLTTCALHHPSATVRAQSTNPSRVRLPYPAPLAPAKKRSRHCNVSKLFYLQRVALCAHD